MARKKRARRKQRANKIVQGSVDKDYNFTGSDSRRLTTPAANTAPKTQTLKGGIDFTETASGAATGAATGAKFGGPKGALIGAGVGAIGGILSGAGGENVSGLDQDDIDFANDAERDAARRVENQLEQPISVGPVQYQGPRSARDIKFDALTNQIMENKGVDKSEATRLANRRLRRKGSFSNIKNFKQAVNRGEIEGLSRNRQGRIKVDPSLMEESYTGSGDEFVDDQKANTDEVFESFEGLPGEFADEASKGLEYRDDARNKFMQTFSGGGQFDAADVADIKSILNLQKMNMRNLHGQLQDSGFMSSNLAKRGYQNVQENVINDAFTKLAGDKERRRMDRARTLLGSADAFGGPRTFGEFKQGSFTSPTEYGGTTDPQGIGFAMDRQRTRGGFADSSANRQRDINLTPRYA